ncbi:hypothetical protein [Paenibacillus sp. sgz500958]
MAVGLFVLYLNRGSQEEMLILKLVGYYDLEALSAEHQYLVK